MQLKYLLASTVLIGSNALANTPGQRAQKSQPAIKPRNIVFILSDDHRYDYMGFINKVPWLKTPHMDRMVAEGAYIRNAFVTTSLCSPSRASILTGMYSHSHKVVDN